ncbi:Pyridoxal phosphate-dependent transferase major region subdomain 1 [Penicillium verhagenii]|uniref:Pyridoxal phosphate-dependent transferase major region subdomain 1 n=1 Tax=Penicillium verhagenii TaxID=1562060 RepID=UPI0025454516|nr:Pyridoxal phosphate-dependent transferase major region subdomain 1 [Penicillium verhagenii]KAJ5948090.1 Pyridoxal phosphate-dependent transferase major region subdomain 1 [Penicillium verhagenii]
MSSDTFTPFGHEMRKYFSFAPGYRNMNHGSFGASPRVIRDKANALKDECESTPCPFIKYRFPQLLDENRVAISKFLSVPESTIVLVPNATTGVNTVLQNIRWNDDGKDEILELDVIYGACEKMANYICETHPGKVRTRQIGFAYPLEPSEMISIFQEAISTSKSEGYRPRVAIFDTISSNPGLRLPFEALAAACRAEGILSLVDAAHGIGQIDLKISSWDPDFLVTNCHKWLFTPRACAVFYVPERNQSLMRSTMPTSHGFVPQSIGKAQKNEPEIKSPAKSYFVSNFEFVGTAENAAFLTVGDAIKWREEVCGGESRIRDYCINLAQSGGRRVADILRTRILDNASRSFTDCCMVNILLPLNHPTAGSGSLVLYGDSVVTITEWMQQAMIKNWKTFMPVFPFHGQWWVRLSGQVYLDESDFEWAGWTLKTLCEEIEKEKFV